MRILEVLPSLRTGGAERLAVDLAKELQAMEHQVTVCCLFGGGRLEPDLQRAGIDPVIWCLPRRSIYIFPLFIADVLRAVHKLCGLIRERQIEVMHAYLSGQFLSALAALRTGIPVVWTIPSVMFLGTRRWSIRKWLNRQLYAFCARRVATVVAVSEEVHATVCKVLDLAPEQVLLVHNGIDIDTVDDASTEGVRSLRSEIGLPETAKLIVTVAGLRAPKGHSVLLDAASEIVRLGVDAYFLLVGEGDLEPMLRQQVSKAGLGSRVLFLGHVRDVNRILRECDMFVLPSLWEGLSLALLEAMRAGKPIVATDVSGTREAIVDGKTGLLVPPGDAQELAKAVLEVLQNPTAAQAMARQAYERVRTEFSAEMMAKRYLSVFQRAVSDE